MTAQTEKKRKRIHFLVKMRMNTNTLNNNNKKHTGNAIQALLYETGMNLQGNIDMT